MPITLTDEDLPELQRLLDELRHKDAVPLINFLGTIQRRAQMAVMEAKSKEVKPAADVPAPAAKPSMPAPLANGHADQPRPSASIG